MMLCVFNYTCACQCHILDRNHSKDWLNVVVFTQTCFNNKGIQSFAVKILSLQLISSYPVVKISNFNGTWIASLKLNCKLLKCMSKL